ncbi:hypothetical protein HNP46_001712 [Pseudomonas nitritireducens]|uniref:Uncharacterized protein n=1 Tax=Pseudomonas nitroreducens TaxID=46680 RepID=A0A7W7P119_PSENT|nr:hypothetical protein [Pseudomonas nitritireducens]MBB4862867.1 hypothetical protein [Pseudomonas nitritireducens]
MAAGNMENDGLSSSVPASAETSAEGQVNSPEAPSRNIGANSELSRKNCVQVASFVEQVAYAISSKCNKAKLSAELVHCQTAFVSSLKQQLRLCPEVLPAAFAIESEQSPVVDHDDSGVGTVLPQVTESRRGRCHPAGRPGRSHESRAARRAGSQG